MNDPVNDDLIECVQSSHNAAESMLGSATRVDVWLLLEYSGRWAPKALEGWAEAESVKAPIHAFLERTPNARFQFVRRESTGTTRLVAVITSGARAQSTSVTSYGDIDKALLDGLAAGTAGEPVNASLFLVCTHGKRDRCCARFGPAVYRAMAKIAPEQTWQTSHLGGHRFAATLVEPLSGAMYGRVTPEDAAPIVKAHQANQIALQWYRGSTTLPPAAQAAEALLRASNGWLNQQPLTMVRCTKEPLDLFEVTLRDPEGAPATVRLKKTPGKLVRASCAKEKLTPKIDWQLQPIPA
ncbi:MAG: hypothetical protein ACI9WU_001349 [Myxococcota bacterium]|jgi:hypothetical protein